MPKTTTDKKKSMRIDFEKLEIKQILEQVGPTRFADVCTEDFEKIIKILFAAAGFIVKHVKHQYDFGADFIAEKNNLRIAVAVRHSKTSFLVDNCAVKKVLDAGKYYGCNKCLMITNSRFSISTSTLDKHEKVTLWAWEKLASKIQKVYGVSLQLIEGQDAGIRGQTSDVHSGDDENLVVESGPDLDAVGEYIYLMNNPSMEGLVKIGKTKRSPAKRAEELGQATGVPTPFDIIHYVCVSDCAAAEKYVHGRLDDLGYRVSPKREFFKVAADKAIELLNEACSKFRISSEQSPADSHAASATSKITGEEALSLPTSARRVPQDIFDQIKQCASQECKSDLEMLRYTIDEQVAAYREIQELTSCPGVPQEELSQIKQLAAAECKNDFAVQSYEITEEIRAYSDICNKTSHRDVPQGVFEAIKLSAKNEWPSKYVMQLNEIKEECEAFVSILDFDSVAGVQEQTLVKIKSEAASEWPSKYGMQLYTIQERVDEYRQP